MREIELPRSMLKCVIRSLLSFPSVSKTMEPHQVSKHPGSEWVIDRKYSTVEFVAKRLFVFTLKGSFLEIEGTIRRDEGAVSRSYVEAVIKSAGVHTGTRGWDVRLQSAEFLDSETYPEIRFESATVEKGRDRHTLKVTGDLSLRGTTRQLELEVEEVDHSISPQGEEVAYYASVVEIDRHLFGMTRRAVLLGRKIRIRLQIQALRIV